MTEATEATETRVDRTPSTYRGGSRYAMITPHDDTGDLSPRLPAQSAAQAIQAILSAPAPVPDRAAETMRRQPEAVQRERLLGDNSRSSPTERALAALIRSIPVSMVMLVVGLIMAMVTPLATEVVIATVLGVLGTLVYYNAQEYRHSQAGVERLRSKSDHKLDMEHERNRHAVELEHEQNRHAETMAAITGDVEIKLRVLDLAAGNRQLADRGQQRLLRGE